MNLQLQKCNLPLQLHPQMAQLIQNEDVTKDSQTQEKKNHCSQEPWVCTPAGDWHSQVAFLSGLICKPHL